MKRLSNEEWSQFEGVVPAGWEHQDGHMIYINSPLNEVDEKVKWCEDNLLGRFFVEHYERENDFSIDDSGSEPIKVRIVMLYCYRFIFQQAADAILFKLRWGEFTAIG